MDAPLQNQSSPKTAWYNDRQMVGTLLIFWPPVGLYGVYKSEIIDERCKWIAYVSFAIAGVLLAATLIF